ncbi:S8 family serine peptidase [Psychrobacillus sp. INOP01]|uniref:S8 family peptidase n=1 Tax=Psychrobacillus sp. INOP01 TaxID=2829187 RepID=UPI001BA7CDB7|nr:S8 family serine peptidase [Psychrobacillus sp. INOP01]QUG40653.1 S8 family serine peptidase [Psychrobacillus sp. INOP01]
MRGLLLKMLLGCSFSIVLFFPSIALSSSGEQTETDRVIVEVTDKEGNKEIESIAVDEVQPKSFFTIAASSKDEVNVLQPDYIRTIGMVQTAEYTKPWGAMRVGTDWIKSQFATNAGEVIVAVIDTGVDYTHSFLKERMVAGYDFVDNDTDPMDEHFHGTHIAGIIAESTTANVKIMPIRALNETGNGYDSNIAKSIHYAVDNGASLVNMSFQGNEYSEHLAAAIDYALSNDVLVVVSSGNKSDDTANYYPASEKKVLVVSATDQSDKIAVFSNTGGSIDISAPGVGILSSIPGEKYAALHGTSMAAPYVSGVAAMLLLDDPTRSIEELEKMLKTYVDDKGAVNWDPLFGEGILNVSNFNKHSLITSAFSSSNYINLPEHINVPLDKTWTILFNQVFSDDSTVAVKLYTENYEIPIQLTPDLKNKKIIVSPTKNYQANTEYLLDIQIKNGNRYLMRFKTK